MRGSLQWKHKKKGFRNKRGLLKVKEGCSLVNVIFYWEFQENKTINDNTVNRVILHWEFQEQNFH